VTGARNPRSPTISPDRSLIAYISGAGSQAVPRVIGADGTGDRPFLSDASHCRRSNRPAWSPDGSEVVVVCRDDATPTLLLLRADGTFVRDLPTTAVPWGNPTWVQGPQGPAVVFAQTGGGSTDTELWAIDPSSPGNQPVQVTRGPADSHADGAEDKLLFLRGTVPRADLGTVVIKDKKGIGRGEQELTALGEVSSPAWSPDATEIAYLKQGSLWVASADGSNAHRLPVGGEPGPPAWGSR
jgi:Tol biopolymer transport system component